MRRDRNYLPYDSQAADHPFVKDHGWTLSIREDTRERRLYDAVPPKKEKYFCPDCGEKGWIKDERWSDQAYVDLKRFEKRVELFILRRRLECSNPKCHIRSFKETLPEVNHSRHLTHALTAELISHIKSFGSSSRIALEYGLDEQVLRNVEKDFVAEQDALRRKNNSFRLPRYLGIHSAHIGKQNCCLLVNPENACLLEIANARSANDLIETMTGLFDSSQFEDVALVLMSLNVEYRQAVQQLFPKAKIIVPRFEVEAIINRNLSALFKRHARRLLLNEDSRESMERALRLPLNRLTKQKNREMEKLFAKSPILKAGYDNKQSLLQVLTSPTKERGWDRYNEWSKNVACLIGVEFVQDLDGWRDAIFDALPLSFPNYLSRIEALIALLKRLGPAYSFSTVRGRLLYGTGHARFVNTRLMSDEPDHRDQDVGVSIDVLVRILERELAV